MPKRGMYTKTPCKFCGRVVSNSGAPLKRHAKVCEGTARVIAQQRRRLERASKIAAKGGE